MSAQSRPRRLVPWIAAAVALAIAPGCRSDAGGLGLAGPRLDAAAEASGSPNGAADAVAPHPGADGPRSEDLGAADAVGLADGAVDHPPGPPHALSPDPPPGPRGDPAVIGCADGSREGFANLASWPGIAGCAGGFRVRGLAAGAEAEPRCGRQAGNTGANPAGIGCAAQDLCAPGWQICADAGDVARHSPTGCAGAVPAGFAAFFLVGAGASADGLCLPGAGLTNDLHGCGSFGDPTHPSCAPLDRRLDFAACYATRGLWSCGDDQTHLQETVEVSKAGPGLGGVLCCKQDLP
jgi:hypothetical protein